MDPLLTRLRDFSCNTFTFEDCGTGERSVFGCHCRGGCPPGGENKLESALAWLRKELVEMRSQDQALVRQLMELHSGILELKQELFDLEQEEEGADDGEDGTCWEYETNRGSGSVYSSSSSSGETVFTISEPKLPVFLLSRGLQEKRSYRRSSMP